MRSRSTVFLTILVLGFGPACHHPSPASPAPPSGTAPPAPLADCTAEFPQLPLSEVPQPSRAEFCKFVGDNLCYCGCPHTLEGCLKEHPGCHHASRMAALALGEIAGAQGTAESAARLVAGYYESFKAANRVQLPVSALPCRGPSEAKLTLVEFSDFDCPHCKAARPLFEKLVEDRHDTRLCFASFPLHKHSGLAAAAASYAQQKGAFWRYHDLLFESQDARATLDEPAYIDSLLKLATQAGLDQAGLKAVFADPDLPSKIEAQRTLAHDLKIEGTPWVYVNGRVVPPLSPELYKMTLDDELEWISNDSRWARD